MGPQPALTAAIAAAAASIPAGATAAAITAAIGVPSFRRQEHDRAVVQYLGPASHVSLVHPYAQRGNDQQKQRKEDGKLNYTLPRLNDPASGRVEPA